MSVWRLSLDEQVLWRVSGLMVIFAKQDRVGVLFSIVWVVLLFWEAVSA